MQLRISVQDGAPIYQQIIEQIKYLIAAGRDVRTVQTILRHANPLTTLQLYAHGRT